MDSDILACRLKELREERNYNQYTVELLTGIDRTSISAYERGTRIPTLKKLVKLAGLYRVSLDYLCGRTEEKDIKFREEENLIYQKTMTMLGRIDLSREDE